MGANIGYFFGTFMVALVLPVLWMLVGKAIPALRRRPRVVYNVAVWLCFVAPAVSIANDTLTPWVGAALAAGLVYWRTRKSAAGQQA